MDAVRENPIVPPATPQPSQDARRRRLQPADLVFLGAAALALGVVAAVEPAILSAANLTNVVRQSAFLVIFALAQMFPLLTRGLDLSQGAQIAMVSVVYALLAQSFALPQAIVASVLIGTVLGAVNGGIIAYWKVSPFVVTLGLGSITQGSVLIISHGQSIFDVPPGFSELGWGSVFGVPIACLIAFVIGLATLFFLARTVLGRSVYAVGSNPDAARLSGVNVPTTLLASYVLAAFVTACGAVLLASRVSSGSPTLGADTPLQSISAAVIGGVSLLGGRGTVAGTVLGALFLGVLANALNLLNLSSFIQQIVIGAVVITAVILDRVRQSEAKRRANRSRRQPAAAARAPYRLPVPSVVAWRPAATGAAIALVGLAALAGFLALGRRDDGVAVSEAPKPAQAGTVLKMRSLADFPQAVAKRRYKIGVLFPIQGLSFWNNEGYGVIDEARKAGVDVVWLSAGGYQDVATQLQQIEDMVSSGVDGILLGATSTTGTAAAVDQAVAHGVKVVTQVSASGSTRVSANVSDDYYAMGQRQADYIAAALKGTGGVVMLSGPAAADWSMREAAGFHSRLKEKYPGLRIVSEHFGSPQRLEAERVIEDILVSFPADRVKAIYTATDSLAFGAIDAAEKAGRIGGLYVSTSGFSAESPPFIQRGALAVDIDENPTVLGRVSLDAMVRALNGETLPNFIYAPTPAITRANVDAVDPKTQWAPKDWVLK